MRIRWARAGAVLLLSTPLAFLGSGCPTPSPCTVNPTPEIDPMVAVATTPRLEGWVDLHTHPISNLGFAGKLVYGGVDSQADGGAKVAADPDCNENVQAKTPEEALGHCGSTHGPVTPSNLCGDDLRAIVVAVLNSVLGGNTPGVDSTGYPDFGQWPRWNEVSHQVMWIDSIKRAYQGGLRVMVALAVNNQTLADAVAGPGDGPDDDMRSADLQLAEIKSLAARHGDWMAIAYQAADIPKIVQAGKLAVVMGLEVDNIGDFNKKADLTEADVHAEISRLYEEGMRYLFPIHVIDNPFGTAAAYQDIFNLSNLREAGHFYNLVCSSPEDLIGYEYQLGNPLTAARDPFTASSLDLELAVALVVKLGMADDASDAPVVPTCDTPMTGMVNRGAAYPGLTPIGKFAILDMMSQGIFIDVDHMSQAAATDTLALALQEKYPVNSGHNEVRQYSPMPHPSTERNLSSALYAQIGQLHGMAGVGVASTNEVTWVSQYQAVLQALGQSGAIAGFGTDTDGLSPLMPPPPPETPLLQYTTSFPQSGFGCATWNYNDAGVAHYGMLADLVQALPLVPGGAQVRANLMQGTQYFYDTWTIIDAYRAAHQTDGGAPAVTTLSAETCGPGTVYAEPCHRCLPPSATCANAAPACPSPRHVDEWGLCVPATPPPAPTGPAKPLPLERRLPAGWYTVQLQARHDARGARVDRAQTFDFEVGTDGRMAGLDGSEAGGVQASGELRAPMFVMRVRAGVQRLALIATGVEKPPIGEVLGAFAAYTPGPPVITGSFTLRPAAPNPPSPSQPLTTVQPFLEALHQ